MLLQVDNLPIDSLRQLSWEIPVLVVSILGVIVPLAYRRQYPGSWMLILSAFAILLATSVGGAFLRFYLLRARMDAGRQHLMADWLLPSTAMLESLLRTLAFGLLLFAFFRPRPSWTAPSLQNSPVQPVFVVRLGLALIAVVLYLVALASPAVDGSLPAIDGYRVYRGWECLVELPLALMFPAWWANPLFVVGLACMLFRRVAIGGILGVIALLLSLSFCLDVLKEFERNRPVRVGYWLWVASMAVLAGSLALAAMNRIVSRQAEASPRPQDHGQDHEETGSFTSRNG